LPLLALAFALLTLPASASASLVIETPAPEAKTGASPTFSGHTEDLVLSDPVKVAIYAGATVTEAAAQVLTASPQFGGGWSVTATPLASGTYTAKAEQVETGGGSSASLPVTFVVEAEPPTVTLTQPASPSNKTTPKFTGTASDITTVTVHLYKGSNAGGSEVENLTAAGGGNWASGPASPALESGEYTAVATQPSSLGNPEGRSSPVTFVVDTEPPRVTLDPVASPSKSTAPSFSGSASASTPVVVHIHDGSSAEGAEVAKVTASGTGGAWSAGPAALSQGKHTYTAVATQESPLGNPEGRSGPVTFVVDTEPPKVSLDPVASPSNNTAPSFSGSASATTPVVVHVYEGATAEGPEVSKVTVAGTGGAWSSGAATLAHGEHTYTAVATQASPLGNPDGSSGRVTFIVNTEPPNVTIKSPALVSNNTTPSFSGTASDTTPVTIRVYKGGLPEGAPVATLKALGTGGVWESASVSPSLKNGPYTAEATQPSSIGNKEGVSHSVTFEVNTEAPTVTLSAPASPSNNTAPSFSGTASEGTQITVEIFEGTRPEGRKVATVTAPGTHGPWVSAHVTPSLPSGDHTYTAFATQGSGIKNPAGVSAPVTFVVDTEAPTVTLNAPRSPANNTAPVFSGAASEATQVTVEVFAGPTAEGKVVATATAPPPSKEQGGGSWISGHATPDLGTGTFTARATLPSAIGNAPGRSAPVTFVVDTSSPNVTLNALPSPSGNASPSFTGTASDREQIIVSIYPGTKAEGTVVATATAEGGSGEWASGRTNPSLPQGQYTAVAGQPSSIGNPPGVSPPITFVVEPVAPVVATESVSSVTRTSATLSASIDPKGGTISSCSFEYGATTAYGETVECAPVAGGGAVPASGPSGPVFAKIFGLSSNTTYHFRIAATDEAGTGRGADATFTTLPPRLFNEGALGGTSTGGPQAAAHGLAAGGVAAFIALQLKPAGRTATIAALLRTGIYRARLKAPEAGTALVKWYYKPARARRAPKSTLSAVLVASGSVVFRAAETATLKIRLTAAGRRLLIHARRVQLTATCVFVPVGGAAITTAATFGLVR
jgi:hypothetical protein